MLQPASRTLVQFHSPLSSVNDQAASGWSTRLPISCHNQSVYAGLFRLNCFVSLGLVVSIPSDIPVRLLTSHESQLTFTSPENFGQCLIPHLAYQPAERQLPDFKRLVGQFYFVDIIRYRCRMTHCTKKRKYSSSTISW